jgi:hypothetical protein
MRIGERGSHTPATSATWLLGRQRPRRPTVIRSLLLSAAVFALAAVTGALLAGAAPASPAEAPESVAAGPARDSASQLVFAQSMVYSGTAALTLSVTGIVMVGRRRRLW